MRPYPAKPIGGQIVGHAFLPCVSVEYHLQGMPLQVLIMLDAADPGAPVASLPDFKPVRGAPGFLDEGGLTARREGRAWLIVGQGSGVAQRVDLLRHLTALVRLGALVPASTGVPAAGQGTRRHRRPARSSCASRPRSKQGPSAGNTSKLKPAAVVGAAAAAR